VTSRRWAQDWVHSVPQSVAPAAGFTRLYRLWLEARCVKLMSITMRRVVVFWTIYDLTAEAIIEVQFLPPRLPCGATEGGQQENLGAPVTAPTTMHHGSDTFLRDCIATADEAHIPMVADAIPGRTRGRLALFPFPSASRSSPFSGHKNLYQQNKRLTSKSALSTKLHPVSSSQDKESIYASKRIRHRVA
jgi:hypothetical protein